VFVRQLPRHCGNTATRIVSLTPQRTTFVQVAVIRGSHKAPRAGDKLPSSVRCRNHHHACPAARDRRWMRQDIIWRLAECVAARCRAGT
jgi:hypothetical protein